MIYTPLDNSEVNTHVSIFIDSMNMGHSRNSSSYPKLGINVSDTINETMPALL